ncbi:MAG: Transporter [Verrucomicrobiales bacterium]|nr:Transporter [Verrucomicrobiales bacterium]
MNQFYIVLMAVLPVFSIIGAGIFMRKVNWLTEEADKSLMRITINVLAPALIFDSILHNDALKNISNVVVAPLVGFGTAAMGMGIALALRKFITHDKRILATFAVCVGVYNYGYIPVPLVNSLFDRTTLGVLFVHNLGVEICIWTLGLMVLGANSNERGWRQLINAPVIAIIASLAVNFLGLERLIPAFALSTAKMLGQCSIPMGLILVGATMADHMHEFHSAQGWRIIAWGCFIRLGLAPILFMVLAKFLPCSVELKRVIIIQGAMPAATFPIVMAKHYNGDPPTALRVLLATSVLGLITIPLWIRFGIKFVFPEL